MTGAAARPTGCTATSSPPRRGLRATLLALASLAVALLPGCASNPATGDIDIVLMSESAEIKKGKELHEQLLSEGVPVYDDPLLQDYVNRVGQRLAKHSARPNIEYTFTVLDNGDINAFALPGGYIYINRGLLAYLDNEAELASVLAHEIGHVTARHAVRQMPGQVANQIVAGLTYLLTGSGSLASTTNRIGTSLVRGYGREHELEADSEGAIYMHNAGYDPNAMLETIGVLKTQQQYARAKAKNASRKPQTYHGVFSTHPRNDRRLLEVIRAAKALGPTPAGGDNAAQYREATNGLAYGKSVTTAQRQESRYYHERLGFTFAHPKEWTVDQQRKSIITHNADHSAQITLTMARKTNRTQTERDFLGEKLGAARLFQSAPLRQSGLLGHTGVDPAGDGRNSRRLAVLVRGDLAYLFEGEVTAEANFASEDDQFLLVVESFRPAKKSELRGSKQQQLRWVQADGKTTYAQLARKLRLRDAENQLRLINGHYPQGEPAAGDWIKVVEQ